MRLLQYSENRFSLSRRFLPDEIPKYAILSHRWGRDEDEVTYADIVSGVGDTKAGYKKLKFCAQQAERDNLQYMWVDTCCIDKTSSAELQESITSMFSWYRNSARCYVYLPTISAADFASSDQFRAGWEAAFRANDWFTRGWTLQELVAPTSVEFFSKEGSRLGDKHGLLQLIHDITTIPKSVLQTGNMSSCDAEERFRWAEQRATTRGEDTAYCLFGIFDVHMTIIYGEGKEHAVRRLKEEVHTAMKRDDLLRHQAESRVWLVPFERNHAFTHRETELQDVRERLVAKDKTARVAVTGLGGIGKTNLILELFYRMRDEYQYCSFIWIAVTSEDILLKGYRDAAKALGVPGCDDEKADFKRLVQDHLSREETGRWILVFDNCDNANMWTEKSTPESQRLLDCLPKSTLGSIIFTTRDRKLADRLADRNIVDLQDVGEEGGTALLLNYLRDQTLLDNEQDAATLLQWLAYLPLAIVQASHYINENDITLGDYVLLLKEQEEDVVELLSEEFEDQGRYTEDGVKNPIATTWLISFERIQKCDSLAADYLSFMACIDTKDIPESLLPPGTSKKQQTDAIGTLKSYSFISHNRASSLFSMHRLVHLAMRNWLRKEDLLDSWTHEAIKRLGFLLHEPDISIRDVWRSYMPHAYYALRSGITDNNEPERQSLLWGYAEGLFFEGRYNEAEAICIELVETLTTKLGDNHPNTLTSMNNLALAYSHQGRWDKAEKLQVQVMEAITTKLGVDHPVTLASMNNLASTYWSKGRWDDAEKLQVQVIEARTTKLGVDHPDTLSSMNNLPSTYMNQGRLDEAEKLQVQVMEASTTKLGVDHPNTLTSMGNLALTWKKQGRHTDALALMKDCALRRQRKLGLEHPSSISSAAFVEEWSS